MADKFDPDDAATEPARKFGYIPDPNFTQQFRQAIAEDSELQTLIETERRAIFADTTPAILLNWLASLMKNLSGVASGFNRVIPVAASSYTEAGGSIVNARRIFQLATQAYVQKKLDAVDIPGPDAWIKPKVYELIIKFAGEGFDEAIKP